jgi:hypothetical protein
VPAAPYAGLTDDQIIELGAALENELAEIHAAQVQSPQLPAPRFPTTAGLKLGVNCAVFAAGLALAPITFNISLVSPPSAWP